MAAQNIVLRRALIIILGTALAVFGWATATAPPAAAAAAAGPQYNVVDRPATAVTGDALPTVQIDGVVWDQAIVGDTVYAGGQFANARPAGAAAGTNLTPRANLLSFNIRTGVLNTGFAPTVNGRIRAMALSPDKSRLYIAGSFLTVNGQTRNHVAAFNTSDGSLVAGFAPNVNDEVCALVVTSTAVYVGGSFSAVNGVARKKLAAVSPTSGSTLAWSPTADATVYALTTTPDNSRIIVGGMFTNLNSSPAYGLGSLDAATGALYPFAANNTIRDYGSASSVNSLKTNGGRIYGSGYWFGGTAGNFEGPFVADPYTGKIIWMADCHGDTYDTSVIATTVYSVSHHHDCTNINGFPDTNPRVRWQRANAFTLDSTTTVGPNTQGGYFDFTGQPAPSIVNWFPEVQAGTYTGQGQGGWTSEATSEYLVQGGEFPRVNGMSQQGIVRFAVPSLAPKKQGPVIAAADSAPTLRGISGSSVRASWPANWDRDDRNLTYKLYRTKPTLTVVNTQTVTSQFWNRPTQIFTDTGLTPNTTYGYYVEATDPNGNTLKSTTTSITTGATVVDDSNYSKAVQTDGAAHYWRLNETSGSTTSTDWAGANDLVLGSGVGLATAGAINGSPDQAANFDGTANGTAGQTSIEAGTDTFSTESWIRTTSTSGGKIIGFGNSQLGTSNNYDRQVYMDNSGHLIFGVCCTQGTSTVAAPGTYNDGAWHHVVSSLSAAGGMQLYVDGLLEGSNPSVTTAQPYSGYWRVGGDNLNAWPYDKASDFLAGTIDDVSVYPTALSAPQIRDHYTKSGRTVNIPTEPSDAYGKQVFNDSPSLYWRLNEAGGTAVSDSSSNRTPGDAFGGVTFGAASTVAPGTAAGFNGSDGTIASAKQFTNPNNYSEEVWFNTTTTDGGKLIGFGDQRSGRSNSYDRHVYMENSGQLTFGVWTGQSNTTTSASAYNDGQWHYMVATQNTTNGMALYVDGAVVGTNAQTQAQGYTGYWRAGGDSSWGGNSSFLSGTLDEVAVYPYALTQTQVRAHYQASAAAVNTAPVASFSSSCTDATCYFDGSASTDPDGTIASYAWAFGDGGSSTTATASHTFTTSGTYTATLTVKDNGGKSTSVSHDVIVTVPAANQIPTAEFSSSCVERVCSFDSSASGDPDGSIISYAWDFDDTNVATTANPVHTYAADRTYAVKLTVTDNKGAIKSVTHSVTVQANVKPNAAFTSDCTNLVCSFDATSSTDSDGTVAAYAWDFGDGTTAAGATATHTFTAGAHDVTLVVKDDKGASDSVVHTVTVQAANQSPQAAFTSTTAGLKATFDAATSTDPDGTIASYAWTFGDGSTATGANPSHTYASANTYDVTLTVTDNRGGTDQVTKSVTVTAPANQVPIASFTATTSDLRVAVNGGGSTDPDGTVASYAWNYGDGSTGTGSTDSHTYAAAGTYSVKLTVTDDRGGTGSTTKPITVTAAPVSDVVAKDTFSRTGSRWGTADTGGAWTDAGLSYFSTNGSKGVIKLPKAGVGPIASLNGVSVQDSTTEVEFSTDKAGTGGGNYLTLSSRRIGTSEYRLSTRVMPDNSVRIGTAVIVSGTQTTSKEVVVPNLTYAPGDVLKVSFSVTGNGTTTLAGKVWKASTTEPATAQVTSTNTEATLQAAGSPGLQGYLSATATNAPVVLTFDNYVVTRKN